MHKLMHAILKLTLSYNIKKKKIPKNKKNTKKIENVKYWSSVLYANSFAIYIFAPSRLLLDS